jgi:hypothetical protein
MSLYYGPEREHDFNHTPTRPSPYCRSTRKCDIRAVRYNNDNNVDHAYTLRDPLPSCGCGPLGSIETELKKAWFEIDDDNIGDRCDLIVSSMCHLYDRGDENYIKHIDAIFRKIIKCVRYDEVESTSQSLTSSSSDSSPQSSIVTESVTSQM